MKPETRNLKLETNNGLDRLNSLSSVEAYEEFLKCCGAANWANAITQERPFRTKNDLLLTADKVWWSLSPQDWLEAFRSHPKIGEKKAEKEITQTSQKWSEQEQSGVNETAKETLQTLSDLNRQYEKTFGYIFIVCATGKSAEELLSILRERLGNDPEKELRTAAAEQAKITGLRLEKLLNQ